MQPSTAYTVRLAAGATDREGQPLAPFSFSYTTGALRPSLNFAVPSQVATYSATTDPVLYFHAVNKKEAQFSLYRLTASQATRIVSEGQLPPGKSNLPWLPDQLPMRTWTEQLSPELDLVVLASTSLGDGAPLAPGEYLVAEGESRLVFSVVNVALVTKLSFDELLVWALDYDTGDPLSGVVIGAEGPSLDGAARTDASGLASFPIPRPHEIDFRTDRSYLARIDGGGHYGVASTRWSQGSEPWQLGVPTELFSREHVEHLYTDRPIYRTGETVFYKCVVREDDDAAYHVPETSPPLEVVMRDSQGKELFRLPAVLNEFGTCAGEFELPPTAATGGYSVWIEQRGARRTTVTSTHLTVAEFRVPEFEVAVETGESDYVDGDRIDVAATATFFFGGPLANAEANWAALATPTSIRVEGYERYSFRDFDDFRRAAPIEPLRAEGSTVTGGDGVARFSVPAALQGDGGPQQFRISTTVIDQNGQAVANSTTATVHPASYYAGIAPAQYIATEGEPAELNIVTVDIEGRAAPGRRAVVGVYERTWVTTKEQTTSGARHYRSEPVDELVETFTVTTDDAAEATVTYTPRKAGTLRIVAESTDGQGRVARAAAFLWVSGSQRASWRIRNDDVLPLIADRDSYEVGDIAEILVPTPFEGAIGLVTVERGKIITRLVDTFESSSEVLRIRIEDGHVPNVFVGVVLYRPPTEEDPIPRYHVGYVELTVSNASRALTVTVEPDRERAGPGDVVRYEIRTTDASGRGVSAEVALAVVDKAVLSLANEVGPDGLRAFWFQRGLGVSTSSSLSVSVDRTNDVFSESDLGGKGGGGDSESTQPGISAPLLRREFRNTAFWDAQIVTNDDGVATVEVKLPDNLTTWRAQARAVSGDILVGEGTSELLSTQPLLLRPALPRFLRVGDLVTLRVLLRNATASPVEVQVALEAEGVEVADASAQSGTVQPGESRIFEWPAAVTAPGTARVQFTALGSGGLGDAVSTQFPVYLDVTPETTATGGVVTDELKREAVYLPDYALVDDGALEVSVQASLVGVLTAELPELRPLPYESNVRVASRIIATLAARRAEGGALLDVQLQRDVALLIDTQRLDGGWGWCRRCSTNMTITGWVLIALGDVRAAGRALEPRVVPNASELIERHVHRVTDVEDPANPNEHAFLLYALAKVGAQRASTMRSMAVQDRGVLTNWGRSYLVLGLLDSGDDADSREVRALLSDLSAGVIPSANGNHWEDEPIRGSMHNGSARITALALRALTEATPDHPLIEETVRWARGREGGRPLGDDRRARASNRLARGVRAGDRRAGRRLRLLGRPRRARDRRGSLPTGRR